jgi:hypothetical protein
MRRPKRLRRKASEMSGPKALAKTSITYSKLRAACQLVKPEDLPSEVAAALAYYTLTGKKVVHV